MKTTSWLVRWLLLGSAAFSLVACNGLAQSQLAATPSALPSVDFNRQTLGSTDGWGAHGNGVSGGSNAATERVTDVYNRAQLVRAVAGDEAKIVRVHGKIDLSADANGKPMGFEDFRDPAFNWDDYLKAYDPKVWGKAAPQGPQEDARMRSAKRQAAHIVVAVGSNTTILGVGHDAAVSNGMLFLSKVNNVIIRNIHFSDAYDHFPGWDPKDNAFGEWNSEYDNVSLRGATHVWIDHCTFDDGPRPDALEPMALGRRVQHHDGLLDITQQSNYVTVSWNHFRNHDKTNLVGSSDSQSLDKDKLKVTFHHNWWQDVKERSPRVRYGQVHVYNNLYTSQIGSAYPYAYSIGVGMHSRIYSENNAWETPVDIKPGQLIRWLKGDAFTDTGSIQNGAPIDLLGALRAANPTAIVNADVGWRPTLVGKLDPSLAVSKQVRSGAGAGKLGAVAN